MTYSLYVAGTGTESIYCSDSDAYIPLDAGNYNYQEVLDAVITKGVDCWEGDIPADIQTAAEAKLFAQQLYAYKIAATRLAQYVLADGREEVREMQPTGETVFNEETGEMEAVMAEVVTVTAIEPLEPTVELTVYSDDMDAEPTVETIENPEITQDNFERAEAQAVVDATPQAVKEAE